MGKQEGTEYYFSLQGLTVGYRGVPLIRDIQIGVHKGEVVTLIGPNGSGKSTILRSISRQLKILSGAVVLEQKDLSQIGYEMLARKMALVLTERVHPELQTCRDIVAMGRYPYTGTLGILTVQDEDKVDEALEIVHASDYADCDFSQISDGQRQRILLARALCQEPEIMILDEPTSFLDIRHKLEILSILRQFSRQKNMTVILSLHEIELANKISDMLLCVKGDVISHFGTPEEIFREDIIRELYGLKEGTFDPLFGSLEFAKPCGRPKVMVVSAGGSGIPVYRRLQRAAEPFLAGILYTNDVDYRVARALAADVITEQPFQDISEETYEKALQAIHSCTRVIDAGVTIGTCNRRIKDLLWEAKQLEILTRG